MLYFASAQSRGVLTSVDHVPGNVGATYVVGGTVMGSGTIRGNAAMGETKQLSDSVGMTTENVPLSRSYYLWAETTTPTPFAGGGNELLLAALTINGYEDVTQINGVGPKAGVEGTRVDLPYRLELAYNLSTGSTPSMDASHNPTTATTYERTGSNASFDSTSSSLPSVGFSYRTGSYGSTEGAWSGPYQLFDDGSTEYQLIPTNDIPSLSRPTDWESQKWTLSFAIQQSSLREIAGFKTVTIYPYPEVQVALVKNFGKVTRAPEKVGFKSYATYEFESDPLGFPDLSIQGLKGFPNTHWELWHERVGDTSRLIDATTASGSVIDDSVYPTKIHALRNILTQEGTHYLRLYNRFSEASVSANDELVMEWTFVTRHIIRVKAHIHEYGD